MQQKHRINCLSLFNGMSCARMALDVVGIDIENYYSSEIDKFANKTTQELYPDTIHLGNINKWKDWDIDKPDLIIFGSPCQGFSMAGKQLNFNDPRSALFFQAHAIVNHYKPKFFIMENVKMKKEYSDRISDLLGIEPILINSSLLSAQNRNRLYWVGKLNNNGTYSKVTIEQPKDKGLLIKDIIESGIVDMVKSHCIYANYFKGGNLKSYFEKHRRQLVFELKQINDIVENVSIDDDGIHPHRGDDRKSGISELGIISFEDTKKTYCLTYSHVPKILCGALRGRYLVDGKRQDHKQKTAGLTEQRLELRKDEKTNTLTTVQKDNIIVSEQDRHTYRKLTPRECLRLQTVPEHIIDKMLSCGVSNTQIYRQAGNGFTVDVIAHLLRELINTKNGE